MDEVTYEVYTDSLTGLFITRITSPAGAAIQLTCPRNPQAFAELMKLADDFYRHLTEISIDINKTV